MPWDEHVTLLQWNGRGNEESKRCVVFMVVTHAPTVLRQDVRSIWSRARVKGTGDMRCP